MNEIKYRGFIIEYTPDQTLTREKKDSVKEKCKGAVYTVYSDKSKKCVIDDFSAAVGYELPDGSMESIELFAREMVDIQYKEYIRIKGEFII